MPPRKTTKHRPLIVVLAQPSPQKPQKTGRRPQPSPQKPQKQAPAPVLRSPQKQARPVRVSNRLRMLKDKGPPTSAANPVAIASDSDEPLGEVVYHDYLGGSYLTTKSTLKTNIGKRPPKVAKKARTGSAPKAATPTQPDDTSATESEDYIRDMVNTAPTPANTQLQITSTSEPQSANAQPQTPTAEPHSATIPSPAADVDPSPPNVPSPAHSSGTWGTIRGPSSANNSNNEEARAPTPEHTSSGAQRAMRIPSPANGSSSNQTNTSRRSHLPPAPSMDACDMPRRSTNVVQDT